MEKKTQFNVWYAIIAMVVILMIQNWWAASRQVELIPYNQFEELLEAGQIEEIYVRQDQLEGKLRKPSPEGREFFRTTRVDPQLVERFREFDVKFTGVVESTVLRDLLSWILPVLFFFGLWMFLLRRLGQKGGFGGLMSVGKSKAKVYVEKDTKVTFEDVAGVDEAKEELKEIVTFLKQPKEYGRLGARIPKGVLLVGPPGTGKTLLARAVAGEAGVTFFSISGSEFVEMFVGVGAARVRDLFDQASKAAPCIIFIDELDALGRARGIGPMAGGHDEKEQTLNQLLSELDGFDPQRGIVLLAATNRPEILDPALLRAGRFDRQILVDRPDKAGRIAILQVHMKAVQIGDNVQAEQIAALTPGFSGADLANLINEAALLATRRGADAVNMDDFNNAIERIVAGLEKKNRLLNPRERKTVAYHEMGHALVAMALPGMDPVHKISIIPRGIGALGYTIQRPTEDRFLMTRQELENKMAVLLGGRAAEMLVFEEISTGAADDLDKATDIARNMVTRFGMSEELGQMTYEEQREGFLGQAQGLTARNYSEETAREIDCAVRELTDSARERAMQILSTYRQQLDQGAKLLLDKETLVASELPRLEPKSARRESETVTGG
ncbi:MAG: ATP-dependent zinc metalloprotease FtsH [Gammaproteobacteria bacterium]|nr:ATP-dependent zinc metalloprotease FtsH [Gammaproteobacteria bacterium]